MHHQDQFFFTTIQRLRHAIVVGPLIEFTKFNWPINSPYLWVDGAAASRHLSPGTWHLSVGDGDSSSLPMDICFSPEKDFSDLAGTLHLLKNKTSHLELRGFSGGRIDHQLAVYGEIFHFLHRDKSCQSIIFEAHHLFLPQGKHQLQIEGNFSLISALPQKIQITGQVKYPLNSPHYLRPFASLGISNQAIGDGIVEITCARPILVITFNPEKLPIHLYRY